MIMGRLSAILYSSGSINGSPFLLLLMVADVAILSAANFIFWLKVQFVFGSPEMNETEY